MGSRVLLLPLIFFSFKWMYLQQQVISQLHEQPSKKKKIGSD